MNHIEYQKLAFVQISKLKTSLIILSIIKFNSQMQAADVIFILCITSMIASSILPFMYIISKGCR